VPKNAAGQRPKIKATYTHKADFYLTLGDVLGIVITLRCYETDIWKIKKLAYNG
jgi:hypothetical protein